MEARGDSFLRKCDTGEYFPNIKYFLECYFIPSYSYDELEKIIDEFKKEDTLLISGLLREVRIFQESGDWGFIQEFIQKYSLRKLSYEKIDLMLKLIIEKLSE